MADLIDRRAAINALDWNIIVTSKESAQAVADYIRGCADRIRSLPSAQPESKGIHSSTVSKIYDRGFEDGQKAVLSAQPDHSGDVSEMVESAYTEGYTAAESKYRKMWDEMQANIKEKAFGKRKGLIHTADLDAMPTIEERKTGMWQITDAYPHNVYCSECHKRFAQTHWKIWEDGSLPRNFCPNCGKRMVREGEDNDRT